MKNILLIGLLIVASSQAFIARAVGTIPPGLTRLSLNGDWQVSAATTNDWIPATVPGCIHTDLLAAKRIPDPFYRDNEAKVQWVGEQAWTYRRTFEVTPDLLQHQHVLLRCEGLDTMATITGRSAAAFAMMVLGGPKRAGFLPPESWAEPETFFALCARLGGPGSEPVVGPLTEGPAGAATP
jgi:hypothetical protein